MRFKFRLEDPKRTCKKHFEDYHSYKKYLREDFNGRCAYCNMKDTAITTPFEIDHFVPRKVFESCLPELETDYNNLVYSCKKCNRAKSNKFEGNIREKKIENTLFYEPVACANYNEVFYRNEYGEICSDDNKGNNTISELNLYRPIHSLAWVCEQLSNTINGITNYMETIDENSASYEILKEINYELLQWEHDYQKIFLANYNK